MSPLAEVDCTSEIPIAGSLRGCAGFINVAAATEEGLRQAQRIRYEAYAAAGWLEPNSSRLFADDFDHLPNSRSHLLEYFGEAVGTMRTTVCIGSPGWSRVPAMEVFGDRVLQHTGAEVFVELSRFAIRPAFATSIKRAQLALLNNAVHAADAYKCRYMVAAVRVSHVPYYRRLEFVQVEHPRPYRGLNFETVLMTMDWKTARPRLLDHPTFHQVFKFPRK